MKYPVVPLLDMVALAYEAQDVVLAVVLVVTLATAIVGLISYRRTGIRKLLLVDIGLFIFFLKSLFIAAVIYLFSNPITPDNAWFFDTILIMDALAAVFIYLSITR